MSAEEPSGAVATAPGQSQISSPPDIAAMLQQIHALQSAQQPPTSVVTTASAPNPLANLEALLSTASLANLAGGFNPLSMLALTSTLNQSSPVYQGIARVLLTMNMGQMLANHQTSELLASMNQQDTLMALLAARGGLPFNLPGHQSQQQNTFQPQQQEGFAVPQVLPHMSLKRNNKDVSAGASERKKSCPQMGLANQGQQQPQHSQQVMAPPPVLPPPKSPSPPPKSMFANLTPEMKEKNEKFRTEILRRLDIILQEELVAEDEEDEKKPEVKQIPTSEEDDTEDSKAESMGAAGSAFRRILSRSSTLGNNSGSPSASGTTSPSTNSLSSGPDSPPLDSEPLSIEFVEMLTSVALMQREQSKSESLFLSKVDEPSFQQNFPLVWSGLLGIKTSFIPVNLHFLNGNRDFTTAVLGRPDADPSRDCVKITQRLRLDNNHVDHIHGVLTDPQYSCCVALTSSRDVDVLKKDESVLQTAFIDYLKNRNIAGISLVNPIDTFAGARVHVFPPSEIVDRYLSQLAPGLYNYFNDTNIRFLFIAFTNYSVEPNMTSPPPPVVCSDPPKKIDSC